MGDFKRGLEELKECLEKESLFLEKLKADVERGEVFFAIRNKEGSFYYKGQNLFKYSSDGFSTNSKFAFVPLVEDYMTEKELVETKAATFINGYESTKERITKYATPEPGGLSALYKYSPSSHASENLGKRYFLVDIEISLEEKSDQKYRPKSKKRTGTDEMDLLLYDNDNQILLFCEAKYYKNPELKGDEENLPKVISQLERYNNQIIDNNVKSKIIEQYRKAFSEYNSLFNTKLTMPKEVYKKCGLYIFGFNLEKIKLFRKRLKSDKTFYGHSCKIIGDIRGDSAEGIFTALTKKTNL